MASASLGYFGLAQEVTAGTAVAANKFFPVKEVDFPTENEFIEFQEIRHNRQAYRVLPGAVRPEAMFKSAFYGSGLIGYVFKGLMGTSTPAAEATSVTAFRHTFGSAVNLPTFTLERADAIQGAGGFFSEKVAGGKVESVALKCAFGEDVEIDVGFQATEKPSAVGVLAAAPTYPSHNPFTFKGATVKIDDVVSNLFTTLNCEFRNTLTRQEALRGIDTSYKISEGALQCTLSGSLIFEDTILLDKFRNATSLEIALELETPEFADAGLSIPYGCYITWPRVYLASCKVPQTAGEIITADVDFKVDFDLTTSQAYTIELVNLDANYT